MHFDVVMMNPPYNGKSELHQQFFNKAVELVKNDGLVISIQPATIYLNKKGTEGKHGKIMQEYVKAFKTNVRFIDERLFKWATIATTLSITTLQKTEDSDISVQYQNRNTYNHVEIEDINKLELDPKFYKRVFNKIKKYVDNNGSLHDITYCYNQTATNCYKIAAIRGNPGDDDFYTMVTRDKNNHKIESANFGLKIKKNQINSVYSYLTSFVARYALAMYKTNLNNHMGEFKIVPLVPFDRVWTDEDLAVEIGISKDDLKQIQKILPDYYGLLK